MPFLGLGHLCIYLSLDFGGFQIWREANCRDKGGGEIGGGVDGVTNENHDEGFGGCTKGMGKWAMIGMDGGAGCACSL